MSSTPSSPMAGSFRGESGSVPGAGAHAFLFFRCAVHNAADLFRLSRPLSKGVIARLTAKFREWEPSRHPEEETGERLFSVYGRLVPPKLALDPEFPGRHGAWTREALADRERTLVLPGVEGAGEPEEFCEFLYLPSLGKCYTLVWRWLPVLWLGGGGPGKEPFGTQDCNGILDLVRRQLGLASGTYLDLYPAWVGPREAESLWEKDKLSVRKLKPWNYRFKSWEVTKE